MFTGAGYLGVMALVVTARLKKLLLAKGRSLRVEACVQVSNNGADSKATNPVIESVFFPNPHRTAVVFGNSIKPGLHHYFALIRGENMRRFDLEQFSGTIVIVGVWLIMIVCLTRDARPVVVAGEKEKAVVTREKLEPRDEKTGEVCRIHRFDELENRTEVEIKFIDKSRAVVFFNALGSRSRAEEYAPDTSKQVFYFGIDGSSLRKHESYRPNGSLKSQTLGLNKGYRITRFADDGKTRISTQDFNPDNTVLTTVFMEDGKTPKFTYRQMGMRAELTTYANGKMVSRDTIERHMTAAHYAMMMMPIKVIKVENITYRPDGKTIWYKQSWIVTNDKPQLNQVEELHEDGATVKHRFKKVRNIPQPGIRIGVYVPGQDETRTVDSFDIKGNLVSRKHLRLDLTVESETLYKGEESTRKPGSGAGLHELWKKPAPGCGIDNIMNLVAPSKEPHHLQQILAD